MVGSVTAVFVASLLFVFFLDHPYENTYGSIKPVDMARDDRTHREDTAGTRCQSARVPCDEADGRSALPSRGRRECLAGTLDRVFDRVADLEAELEKLESRLPEIYASGDQAARATPAAVTPS